MADRELTCESVGHVDVITLDRPEARNALTHTTYRQLEEAVRTTSARCLVITGRRPGVLRRRRRQAGDGRRRASACRRAPASRASASLRPPRRCSHTDVPVVAAVNGAAVGWGMELALMADIRIASDRAWFGELFVKRGLCCDVAGLGRLASLVGREHAAELLFTGRIIDADEARRHGAGVPRRPPRRTCSRPPSQLAGAIAANPPLAVRALKQGLRTALDPDWQELGSWVGASLAELFRTEDHREGVASFLERREPSFVGR